jgi:hypothetical protein
LIASELHRDVYQAFAAADARTLRSLCKAAFYKSLEHKIAQLPEDRRMEFEIIRTIRTKVLHRMMSELMPPREGEDKEMDSTTRALKEVVLDQAVVEIKSEQMLKVEDKAGHSSAEAKRAKKVRTEHIVLQRVYCSKRFGPWKVWGFREPASFDRWMAEGIKKKALRRERKKKADMMFKNRATIKQQNEAAAA